MYCSHLHIHAKGYAFESLPTNEVLAVDERMQGWRTRPYPLYVVLAAWEKRKAFGRQDSVCLSLDCTYMMWSESCSQESCSVGGQCVGMTCIRQLLIDALCIRFPQSTPPLQNHQAIEGDADDRSEIIHTPPLPHHTPTHIYVYCSLPLSHVHTTEKIIAKKSKPRSSKRPALVLAGT